MALDTVKVWAKEIRDTVGAIAAIVTAIAIIHWGGGVRHDIAGVYNGITAIKYPLLMGPLNHRGLVKVEDGDYVVTPAGEERIGKALITRVDAIWGTRKMAPSAQAVEDIYTTIGEENFIRMCSAQRMQELDMKGLLFVYLLKREREEGVRMAQVPME